MRSLTTPLFAALIVGAVSAQACRPRIVEPLHHLGAGDKTFSAIFIGEIVGVRNADRLKELQRCKPKRAVLAAKDENAQSETVCVELMAEDYEVEVYPSEVLMGKPRFPHLSTASDCLARPPKLGAEALVFVTSDGYSKLRIRQEDDEEFNRPYDDAYLEKLEACLAGECPAGVGDED